MPRTVVVVLLYDSERDLEACFGSLRRALVGRDDVALLAVDNASRDGSVDRLQSSFPEVELIRASANRGYSAGNNLGLRRALDLGAEFVYLLNPDTRVEPDFLDRALAVADLSDRIAAVQSMLVLSPAGERIDSAGNALHFLGFGYCNLHGRPLALAPREPVEIAFASGAAVLLRTAALREIGLLDERLFLYCEDLDLGWRLRLAGYSIRLAPDSIVHHRHEFSRSESKYFYLERNRWLVLLKNWSTRSLVLLAPVLAVNELAMAWIALRQGWLRSKLRAWRALLARETRSELASARCQSQARRRVRDREIVRCMTARMEIDYVDGPMVPRRVNPLLVGLWSVLRRAL